MFSAADRVLWSQGLSSHSVVHLNLILLLPSFHFFIDSKHNVDTAVKSDVVLSLLHLYAFGNTKC